MAQKTVNSKKRRVQNRKEDPSVKKPQNGDVPDEDSPILIYYKWCKGCGICVEFCPKQVLEFDETEQKPRVARPQDCIQCGMCELRCPDFAITRVKKDSDNGNSKTTAGEKGAGKEKK